MKRVLHSFINALLLIAGLLAISQHTVRADGRPGSVEWSNGRKLAGAISLTPGKDLRLFTPTGQVSIQLADVKELKFTPEKEETREGFYFPNAGQATQAKTGDIYPTRSIQTEIVLADGKMLDGHLFTTTLYIEPQDGQNEKVVLMAKQTGTNGQKLADLIYPTLIHFDSPATSAGFSQINLSQTKLSDMHPPVVVSKPDLTLLPLQPGNGKSIWTVPRGDSSRLLFSVETGDGIHVAWPMHPLAGNFNFPASEDASVLENNALVGVGDLYKAKALETSLKEMQDFYDTRTALDCFAEGDDIYSLVMMKRIGVTHSFNEGKIPWSLVILHWKYDSEAKKATLLNRTSLAMGRAEGNSPLPKVFMDMELLSKISPNPDAQKKNPTP